MYIYFVRHGQTDDNMNNIVQGRKDNLLNENGKNQAEVVGNKLKELNIPFDKIYSSPLKRAVESATIINNILKIGDLEIHPDLTEREFGNLEGLDVSYMRWLVQNPNFKPVNFETDEQIINRVHNCVKEIVKTGENILIVCHSHTIKAMLTYINKEKYGFDFPLLNAQVVKIKCHDDKYKIEEII